MEILRDTRGLVFECGHRMAGVLGCDVLCACLIVWEDSLGACGGGAVLYD